jgi:hypothetical protein
MSALFAGFPFFIWMLPLAMLPVIFHLFLKMQKRPRPFPTLMFFQRIDPKLSARKQIREWLILLLRALLIFLLMLALARLVWTGGIGTGPATVVIIVDNSGSMSGPANGGESKLKRATEAAHALVGTLGSGDNAGLVLAVEDPTVTMPAGLVSDWAVVRATLDRVAETEATGRPVAALQRAFEILRDSAATRLEVHVFTDLQETEWSKPAMELKASRPGIGLYVHRVPTAADAQPNVSLAAVDWPRKRLLAGRKFPASVTIANGSEFDARVSLHKTDDQGGKSSEAVFIPKREEKTVALVHGAEHPGFHWVHMWIEGDALGADNRAGIGYACADRQTVLFIGERREFGLLPVAMSPTPDGRLSGLAVQFGDVTGLDQHKPVCAVTTWATVPGIEAALSEYVQQGGNLIIVPGQGPGASAPAWVGCLPEQAEGHPEGLPLIVFQKSASVFDDLRDAKGDVSLRNIRAFRLSSLQTTGEATGLVGLEDGRVVLAQRRWGKGTVFASGVAFDSSASTLVLKSGFLALSQSMALTATEGAEASLSLVAGERVILPGTESGLVHIRSLVGGALDWKGESSKLPVLPRAGVYAVEAGGQTHHVVVRSAAAEGRSKFIGDGNVPALVGLKYVVRPLEDLASFVKDAQRTGSGLDFYLPLLLLALAALLVEGWLANLPPRKVVRPQPASSAKAEPQKAVVA